LVNERSNHTAFAKKTHTLQQIVMPIEERGARFCPRLSQVAIEIRIVEAAINGPEAILWNSFAEMTEKLPTTEMTDQRQPADARSFFRNVCGHTLPDLFAGHGRGFETGEEIGAEKSEMLAIKRAELPLRHFCAEGQS
jgi:hypothetical protein